MQISGPILRNRPEPARLFAALVAALCGAGCVALLRTKLRFVIILFVTQQEWLPFLLLTGGLFLLLTALDLFTPWRKILPAALVGLAAQYAILLVAEAPDNIYFNVGMALVLFLTAGWAVRTHAQPEFGGIHPRFGYREALIATVLLFAAYTGIVGYFALVRHMAYGASNFDFGIFAQMFDNMKQTGLPLTTVERNRELTHFAVHFSPALYLLLPGYLLFPCPEYLLIAQAAVVGSGVFAVYAMARRLEFSPGETVLAGLLYVALPSLTGGNMYDFHENCLLAPLVLWMLYFILRDQPVGYFSFALAVMAVKEDAAIYVIGAALFLLLYRRRYLFGSLLLVMALAYFMAAGAVVAWCGGEVMMYRLSNYFVPGEAASFTQVIKTCLLDLGYLFSEVWNGEKFAFLLWILVPLGGMPLLNRRQSALTLLIPLLVINLMPDYIYQYDPSFQYTFGSMGMALLAALLALRERGRRTRLTVLLAGALTALVFNVSLNMPLMRTYWRIYTPNADTYAATTACLRRLPPDVPITATTYLIAHLDEQDEVYMFEDETQEQTLYALLDTRGETAAFRHYLGDAYELVDQGGYCEVYRKKQA